MLVHYLSNSRNNSRNLDISLWSSRRLRFAEFSLCNPFVELQLACAAWAAGSMNKITLNPPWDFGLVHFAYIRTNGGQNSARCKSPSKPWINNLTFFFPQYTCHTGILLVNTLDRPRKHTMMSWQYINTGKASQYFIARKYILQFQSIFVIYSTRT